MLVEGNVYFWGITARSSSYLMFSEVLHSKLFYRHSMV